MNNGDGAAGEPGLFPMSVGERLRAARVTAGLDLSDVATRTRVPMRHLEAIERAEYGGLPSRTYALGFARSYARAVGLDEGEVARDLRVELSRAPSSTSAEVATYQPADPARVPSRLLTYTAIALLVLLAGGYAVWRSAWWSAQTPSAAGELPPVAVAPKDVVSPPVSSGPAVVLTATQPVWLRIYERTGARLFEKEMAAGEVYTLPPTAVDPLLLTGRPQALTVAVDGVPQPPLGPPDRSISDVAISAAALTARASAPVGNAAAPVEGATDPVAIPAAPVASPPSPGNNNG